MFIMVKAHTKQKLYIAKIKVITINKSSTIFVCVRALHFGACCIEKTIALSWPGGAKTLALDRLHSGGFHRFTFLWPMWLWALRIQKSTLFSFMKNASQHVLKRQRYSLPAVIMDPETLKHLYV